MFVPDIDCSIIVADVSSKHQSSTDTNLSFSPVEKTIARCMAPSYGYSAIENGNPNIGGKPWASLSRFNIAQGKDKVGRDHERIISIYA